MRTVGVSRSKKCICGTPLARSVVRSMGRIMLCLSQLCECVSTLIFPVLLKDIYSRLYPVYRGRLAGAVLCRDSFGVCRLGEEDGWCHTVRCKKIENERIIHYAITTANKIREMVRVSECFLSNGYLRFCASGQCVWSLVL